MLLHKKSLSIFFLFWLVITIFPVYTYAEDTIARPESFLLQSFTSMIPEYIISFFKKLKDIQVGAEHITIDRQMPSFENSFSLPSNAKDLWNTISSWFEKNIGFGIKNIIYMITNTIVWIFETLLGILRYGLTFLQ